MHARTHPHTRFKCHTHVKRARTHTRTHARTYAHTHTHTHTQALNVILRSNAHTHTHTRAHTHTHTPTSFTCHTRVKCARTHTHTQSHTDTHSYTTGHKRHRNGGKKLKRQKTKKQASNKTQEDPPWPDFVHQAEVGSADVESLEVNEDHHELLPRHNGSAVSMAEVVLQEMSHLLSNSTSVLMRIIMNCSLDTMAPLSAWRKLYCKRWAIFCQTLQVC